MRATLLIIGALLIAAPALGEEQTPAVRAAYAAREQCRGTPGASPTSRACRRADAAEAALVRAGWCYGLDGQAGVERYWRRDCAKAQRRSRPGSRSAHVKVRLDVVRNLRPLLC